MSSAQTLDASAAPAAGPLIPPEARAAFAGRVNRHSFKFRHSLRNHPLFTLDALVELSRRLPAHPDFAYWSNGRIAVTDPWEKGMAATATLQDTIAGLASNDSIVILKHAEQDPVYGPLLQGLLRELFEASGAAIADDATIGEALVIMSSPGRITPYHFDAELNFLVQVSGDKPFTVYDHDGGWAVSETELEGYSVGAHSSGDHRRARSDRMTTYDLQAGEGVHIPCFAPHCVANREQVSIALSINYELASVARSSAVWRLNHRLRKLGISPLPPGRSPLRDRLKAALWALIEPLRQWRRPAAAAPAWPLWRPDADARAAARGPAGH